MPQCASPPRVVLTACLLLSVAGITHAAILFADDFQSGDLGAWQVVTGDWRVEEEDGNSYARSDGGPFRTMNIADRMFGDVTMTARIWQVSQDHGANIYARNDQNAESRGRHSGYWFGVSGPLEAAGWGAFNRGVQTVQGVLYASAPLDTWVRLEVTLTGRSATMTAAVEGGAVVGEAAFDVPDLPAATSLDVPEGYLGFIVAGEQVRVDDVVVHGDVDSVAVRPRQSAAVTWASLRTAR
ncbi:hypothetical protein HN371_27640 [Candidatus Poribacteria bacterium]|nr:hypothetical protein [Candidatus Poribacteria bacterium]MBT5533713.1 hypothetical protein [Candidatus Poribacteria bacterium]MBT5714280.1 hypothetical protein [Candidatus Poribacteria bacterium]MBT7095943.1 hypothetical protein [Candidatus Poribacteria bacterium]MBT7807942.1 hypothetical protein [Candidatus Poribacteria bacterium]